MKMIERYVKPIEILKQFGDNGKAGMSDFELSFLCGVIKTYKPHKVVEVGVAAGGTTAVILNCLDKMGYECEMYSVDVCKKYYKDTSKETGYVAKGMLSAGAFNKVYHQFMLGHTVAHYEKEIGDDVDLLILDTMHSCPGELLDFAVMLKSLKPGAIVVFHDVGQCQHGLGHLNGAPFEYASLLTMSTVVGEKLMANDANRIAQFANIGALQINEDTLKYIDNMFLALFICWDYIPEIWQLLEYREVLEQKYGAYYAELLDRAVELNTFSLYRRKMISFGWGDIKRKLATEMEKKKYIFLYGNGKYAQEVTEYIEREGYMVSGYIISDGEPKRSAADNLFYVEEFKMRYADELEQCTVILALDEKYIMSVISNIYKKHMADVIFPQNGVGLREMLHGICFENSIYRTDENCTNLNGYETGIRNASRK